jgi:hypothetical protein
MVGVSVGVGVGLTTEAQGRKVYARQIPNAMLNFKETKLN